MIQLNLLPDVKKEFIRARRVRNNVVTGSVLAIAGSVGLSIVFAMYVYGVQKLMIADLTGDIKKNSEKLKQEKDLGKYLTVQNQLAHLDPLHEQKQNYSRLMEFLTTLNPSIPNNIQLETMEIIREEGVVLFKGTAPSAQAFNVYKDTLVNADLTYTSESGEKETEDLFSDVVVEANTLGRVRDQVVVTFIVRAEYNPNAFATGTTGVGVTVPNMQTTQSVRQAPLFNGNIENRGGQ